MMNKYVSRNDARTAYRMMEDEAVVVNLKDSTFHTLNPVASFIWQQADGKNTVGQIADMVCREFEVAPGVAEKDCLEFVGSLVGKDLLCLLPQPVEEGKDAR